LGKSHAKPINEVILEELKTKERDVPPIPPYPIKK
jgi:hypothetical protein